MVDTVALEYSVNKKSLVLAYFLWFFLGIFGAHRFYFRRIWSGVAILVLTLASIALLFVLIGAVLIFVPVIWVLIDALLIPGWARDYNNRVLADIKNSVG